MKWFSLFLKYVVLELENVRGASPKEAFAAAMQSWRERCAKCVCLLGDYVEK